MTLRLAVLAAALAGCAAIERPPAVVEVNDNRVPAGMSAPGLLSARLLLEEGTWFPDDSAGASLVVAAFAERGGAPRIPGPLLRVTEGAEVRMQVENRLALPVVVHGLHARPGRDSLVIPAGATRHVRFVAGEPGTYYYWASTNGHTIDDRQDYDSQLAGAFIVDPAGPPPSDRIFVIGGWFKDADTTARPRLPIRDVMTINGRAWPHTERITAALGDSVTWRVINTNLNAHPMHLHGTYFLVGGRGDWARDTVYDEADQRRVVTELMLPGTTMTMRWAPQKPGNWLFHCHFAFHVSPFTSLTRTLAGDTLGHGDHTAQLGMAGMVLGITVPAPASYAGASAGTAPRAIRLLVQSRPAVFGAATGFGYVVQDGDAEPAHDSIPMPGSPLILERGRPVRITVVNRLAEPTAVHWHGIELSSWSDGVPGWSGVGSQVMPPIAPGDSFVATFTPPRAGTFIYHAHANELVQLAQGLYGALLVMEPGERPDPRREATVIVSLDGPSQANAGGWVNGSPTPAPIVVPPGRPFKLRLISINADARVHFRLLHDSTLQSWRPVAVDGADLPPGQAVPRPADWLTGPGMTQDVMVELQRGERLDLEVSAPHAAAPWTIIQPVVAR